MNVKSKEKQENSAVELVIEVGAEEFEAAVDKVYRKNRKNISVPGFRKGHAPRKIIEGMYGSGVFYEDAIDELYPAAYAQAVEQEGLDPVAYPKVEVVEAGKNGFTFKALVTVRPEYKIGTYKGLSASKEEVKITDEDVENELKPYIQRATRLVNVEREAKEGDTVLIDFEGFDNGVPFEGGKGENYALELGSHSFIPGFEEGVVGLKPGDEKDLDVTFPEDYTPELAGKPVVFKIKVHEVKEPQPPVLDDEFAKDVSDFDTLEEFKKDLGEKLKERREHAAEHAFEDAVMDALIENLEVELPQAMVDFRADQVIQDYAERFERQGIPFQQYLQMTGQTLESMREQGRGAAERQIKYEMALDAVAAAENMAVTDEELEAEYKSMAEQYSMEVDQVKAAAPADDVKTTLLRRKALELVKAEAKAEKPKKTAAKKAEKTEEGEAPAEEAPKKRATRSRKGTPTPAETASEQE
ncbi:MAG TPA: trigger factor [Candidatus Intestinimonas pullistercoris]|uniref:Trigger factor n=1 Tax=Candidatus Intestinimonas pullistercoris TaxID=2838623 RepID=A0A9D2P019_9FIRM|nr:trigger factor [uncultured Intestinimonas sp.]HJC40400.1 trigger factor [Candidatus Intestinimonas pullistercoris]